MSSLSLNSPYNSCKLEAIETLVWWVGAEAVNAKGGFGVWSWAVAFQPAQMHDILDRHAA